MTAQVPFEKSFKVSGHIFNPPGNMQESLEERMQDANKGWWRDVTIHQGKDVPWRIKCRRVVEQVYSVFCLGNESWPWSRVTWDRIEGWETQIVSRLFRFNRKDEETWSGYCMRTSRAARSIWKKMKLLFIVEGMWRAMGWVCERRPNAVQEHCVVDNCKSPEKDGGPWQSHKMEA